MTKQKLKPHAGLVDRRQAVPAVYWVNEQLPGRAALPDRRQDADTRQVLTNLLRLVQSGQSMGLVFGVLNKNGTIDVGMSGNLYRDPVLCKWIAHRIDVLTADLPDHPDQA